jgi:hypothetical protein
MNQVGDRVTVKIRGAADGGTSLGPGAITILPGAAMTIPGRIVDNRGKYWLIELDISFRGRNRIPVDKTSVE